MREERGHKIRFSRKGFLAALCKYSSYPPHPIIFIRAPPAVFIWSRVVSSFFFPPITALFILRTLPSSLINLALP